MLKRIFILLTATVMMLSNSTSTLYAADSNNTAGDIIDGIIDYELNKNNVQDVNEFINKALAPAAGNTPTEWFVLALSRYNDSYDFTEYNKSLERYIKAMDSKKATDYQRISVACLALGTNKDYVINTIATQNGRSGIMSYIYGLIIMEHDSQDTSEAIKLAYQICDFQLKDGGFALSGELSDTDVTAMAIQALAPYYQDSRIRQVVDSSLQRLSDLQQADGGFQSYGKPNCESTAQVLIALNTLGIDWSTDERFIKNNCNVLTGLLKYRLEDGSFSHIVGGETDEFANAQALMAGVSCMVSIYDFDSAPYNSLQDESNSSNDEGGLTGNFIKYGLIAGIVVITVTLIVINAFRKKSLVNVLVILTVGTLATVFIYRSDIKTPDEYKGSYAESITDGIHVSIAIDCSKAEDRKDNGSILKNTEYIVTEGSSVFDLLIKACQENDIQNEFEGTEDMKNIYVKGIDYLYEFDCGELSGWVYTVNGITPGTGCSSYGLEDGDSIKWIYTLDQGRDIE